MEKKVEQLPDTPYIIVYEDRIRANLRLIKDVAERAGVTIVMAFKANALWKVFNLLRSEGFGFAASSMNELRLGWEELGKLGHTYCLAYKPNEMADFLAMSSHLTFNSLTQWETHKTAVDEWNKSGNNHVSPGLRVNPHCSVVETDIYNPALPGSRFGVSHHLLKTLPEGIEGLHFHQLCESDSWDLDKVLDSFEEYYGHLVPQLKWLNMGGGHLMTRACYDIEHLVKLLLDYKTKHPGLEIILEPGSAFMWQTGDLVTTVVDIVEDAGIKTAIIDGSFTCHMPDTLEMPYLPKISQALPEGEKKGFRYNFGGNSCLSGDFKKEWFFAEPLKVGDTVVFEDMNHYTTVKTTMFNGLQHPAIVLKKSDGTVEILREFTYQDYKNRMA